MADNIGELFIEINASVDGLKRDINNLDKKVSKEAVKSGKSVGKSFGSGFQKGLAKALGALYAFKKALDFTIQAKNAARDAAEIESKFLTVFSSMQKEAVNTAQTFARSFGLANSTTKELLSSTGDLLVGFGFSEKAALDMAVQVNSLAQDLASFTNFSGGAAGASVALTKGILGETESVKALGIVLRQNTKEFRAEMKDKVQNKGLTENQARAEILLAEAYKQSTKAVGDYARTKDSLANVERRVNEQMKEAMEVLGQKLLPLFVSGIRMVGNFAQGISFYADVLIPAKTNVEKLTKSSLEQRIVLEQLIISYERLRKNTNKTKTETEQYDSIVGQLQTRYPEILGNLDLQKDKLEKVRKGFASVRKEVEASLRIEFKKAEASDVIGEQEKQIAEQLRLQKLIDEGNAKLNLMASGDMPDRNIPTKGVFRGQFGKVDVGEKESAALKRQIEKNQKMIDMYVVSIAEKQTKINELLSGGLDLVDVAPLTGNIKKEFEVAMGSVTYFNGLIKELQTRIEGTTDPVILLGLNRELEIANNGLDSALNKIKALQQGYGDDLQAKGYEANLEPTAPPTELETVETNVTKPLIDAGSEFENSMYGSLNLAGSIVSTLQSGLFRAGKGFLDYLSDSISLISQIASIVGQFSPTGIIGGLFAHDGGTFQSGKKVKGYAAGGDFIVPSGFKNDSYPIMVESGERVQVTPSNQVGQTDKLLSKVVTSIQALNKNFVSKNMQPVVNVSVDSDSLVRDQLEPSKARLDKAKVKTYDF